MRISETMRYSLFQSCINKVSDQLMDIEKKISTGKNINAPSDDPIIFARAVEYDSQLSLGTQFNDNLQRLKTLVGVYDASLSNIESSLEQVSEMASTYDAADTGLRQSYAEVMDNIIEQLVTVGNTKLGNSYIFGGQQADSAPFQLNNDYSVSYNVSASGEDATSIYVDQGQLGEFGLSGREALYGASKIAFGNVDNTYQGDIYSNTDSFAYVITDDPADANCAIMVDGATYNLDAGDYTGGALAKEIQTLLGADDYSVAFDSGTRKFVITNNKTTDVTFNWSGASAASTLGFDAVDTIVRAGETEMSDIDSGRKSFQVTIFSDGATTGASRATYKYSTDGGATWSAAKTVSTGGADTTGDIKITLGENDTLCLNGTDYTLTNGTYTGVELAEHIQNDVLPPGNYSVSYDAATRKFSITNNTTGVATFNWSDSTAAGVLGFDNVDSVVSKGDTDIGDYDAGMFIDGAGVPNTTNNRIKLAFGTTDAPLVANDTFQVKDLSIFELLKNVRDAFKDDNTAWISKNIGYIDLASSLTVRNNAVVAYEGAQAEKLIANNNTMANRIEGEEADLLNADMATLGSEFNILLNTYQVLLSAFAKMRSISILNYLN